MGNGSAVGMASRCACTWAVTVAGTSAVGAGCGAGQASTPMIKRAAMSSSLISAFSRNNLWEVPDRAATGMVAARGRVKEEIAGELRGYSSRGRFQAKERPAVGDL